MDDLWQVVAELSIELSPARIESAAAAVEKLESSSEIGLARQAFGPNLAMGIWKRLLAGWDGSPGVTPEAVAAGLRASCRVGQLMDGGQAVSLAWTGPKTDFVPVRSTEQVMLEVIQRAHSDLFLVSFVNVGAGTIVAALNEAAERGVKIKLLLEESKGAAEKMEDAVPTARVYVWTKALKIENGSPPTASVHAKCVVADGEEALITSANLTDYALEKNMELGVHIIGGREPRILRDHLNALVITKKIQRLA